MCTVCYCFISGPDVYGLLLFWGLLSLSTLFQSKHNIQLSYYIVLGQKQFTSS